MRSRTSARVWAEEGEVNAEPFVLPRRRAGLGEQLLEPLLALGREPVNDLRSPARHDPVILVRVGVLLCDQPLGQELLQAGVERPVRERAEHSEQGVEPLAQLVPVHGGLVEQAEDGEFENAGTLPAAHDPSTRCLARMYQANVSSRYIEKIRGAAHARKLPCLRLPWAAALAEA
jgi:hypothetical protein